MNVLKINFKLIYIITSVARKLINLHSCKLCKLIVVTTVTTIFSIKRWNVPFRPQWMNFWFVEVVHKGHPTLSFPVDAKLDEWDKRSEQYPALSVWVQPEPVSRRCQLVLFWRQSRVHRPRPIRFVPRRQLFSFFALCKLALPSDM